MEDKNPFPESKLARSIAFLRAQQRLIVALDLPTMPAALDMVEKLEGRARWFKIGLELYIAAGPRIVENLVAQGYSVFLDLKLHDIPNTVASAVRATSNLGASMLTVHAAGGPAMLVAAQEALQKIANPPRLLAVTVLTSMDSSQVTAIGIPRPPQEQVELLAHMGLAAGIRGFVCSSHEVANLRRICGPDATLVIPGIRPTGADRGDQQRIATPTDALRLGASYLVVGRPVTMALDPAAATEAILLEMAGEIEASKAQVPVQ